MTIEITCSGLRYAPKSLTFSGGEQHVTIPCLPDRLAGDLVVTARLQSSDAILRLALATEVLARVHRGNRRLFVPYFPYARQDRVTAADTAFSLKVVAKIINGLGFDEVIICDPHSDVTPALVENIRVVPQLALVRGHTALDTFLVDNQSVVIAPDAGAVKKAAKVAQHYKAPLVTASKLRDVETGEILRTELSSPVPDYSACVIVDDICDGGRTFIELARALRDAGAPKVCLYVTHGIFSQGMDVFSGLIDAVFCTDSFLSRAVESPELSVVPLHVSSLSFDGQPCP